MKIQPINAIESALLHNRFVEIPLDRLTNAVETAMRKSNISGVAAVKYNAEGNVIFSAGDYLVSIIQENVPLAREGFGGCLPQPITIMMMPDAEQRIDAHRAHSFVSITRSQSAAERDEPDDDYSFGDFRKAPDAHRAMTFGYWVVDGLHKNNPATAIHWLPSDHLVSALHFEAAAKERTLTKFFVRPYLYSSAGSIATGNPVGMVANGSQYLLDRPVIFEEAPVDYWWLIERSTQFVDEIVENQRVPNDGHGFSPVDDELFEVLHRGPEASNPMGSYLLVTRNAPQYNIRGGLNSVLRKKDEFELKDEKLNKKLDENDPIDLAIINALKDRAEEMRQPTKVPEVKDRRMGPRETHGIANFGRRTVFGKR